MSQALLDDTADASLPSDGQFINFSGKLGQYMVGRERGELSEGDSFVVNSYSLGRGWCCWKGGKPIARHRWSVYEPSSAVKEADLEDHGPYKGKAGEGWKDERMFSVKGLDVDLEGMFTTTSVSGCNSIADLQVKIAKQAANLEPVFPIIQFGMTQFEAQGQTNYKPVFHVLGWVDQDGLSDFEAGSITLQELIDGVAPKRKKISKKTRGRK